MHVDIPNVIAAAVGDIYSNNEYCNVLAICNSSGVGKTRAVLEYAKIIQRTVYFLCKDIIGGRSRPPIVFTMMNNWKANPCNDAANKIVYSIVKAANSYENVDDLYNALRTEVLEFW